MRFTNVFETGGRFKKTVESRLYIKDVNSAGGKTGWTRARRVLPFHLGRGTYGQVLFLRNIATEQI